MKIVLIFLIALTLRLVSVAGEHPAPLVDAGQYDRIAVNLLTGRYAEFDSPTAWRMPLYPLFLASVYSVFGHSYTVVRVVQSVMGALLCVVIFHIAKTMFNEKVGLLASCVTALYPPFLGFYLYWGGSGFLLSENLFMFLLALFVLALLKRKFILSGVLLGLLALTRPVIGLFPLVLLFLYKKKAVPALIAFFLILSPWVVRNYLVFKTFIPFSTQGGFVLLATNNPLVSGGGLGTQKAVNKFLTKQDRGRIEISEIEKNKVYTEYGMMFFTPKRLFKKLLLFWDIREFDYIPHYHIRLNLWYIPVLLFAVIGIISKPDKLFLFLLAYFSITAMLLASEPRFRYPLEPLLIIFASKGVLKCGRLFGFGIHG